MARKARIKGTASGFWVSLLMYKEVIMSGEEPNTCEILQKFMKFFKKKCNNWESSVHIVLVLRDEPGYGIH